MSASSEAGSGGERRPRPSWQRLVGLVVVVALGLVLREQLGSPDEAARSAPPAVGPADPLAPAGRPGAADEETPGGPDGGAGAIRAAFEAQRSSVPVEGRGVVLRTLPDDEQGSRHQRFVLRLASGQTVLFAHNIDLAPRVPLGPGDTLDFRGQYEWNDRGGVVHWTHHDPAGRHPGGWLRLAGKRYE